MSIDRAWADVLPRSGLGSLDYVIADMMSFQVVAAGLGASPRSIKKTAAGVILAASTSTLWWLQPGITGPADGSSALLTPSNSSVILGLELDADIFALAQNQGAVTAWVSVIVLRRRRILERLPGQV